MEFAARFFLTLFFCTAAAIFYRWKFKKPDVSFAIALWGILVFAIVFFVAFDANSLGLGIGLLGILSLVRLRSNLENLVDVGFVFFAICLGLLNAKIAPVKFAAGADLILISLLFASSFLWGKNWQKTRIIFDEIHNAKLSDEKFWRKKIEEKCGISPAQIEIKRVDFLRDSTVIEFFWEA
jgi:hypothetical protein